MFSEYLTINTAKHDTLSIYINVLHVSVYQNDHRTTLILEFKKNYKYIAICKYFFSEILLMCVYLLK